MTSDIFGSLGGLLKGFSSLMPQDDPQVKVMNAQNQVNDLNQQATAVYTEIGQLAYQQHPEAYPDQANRLRLIQANLAAAQGALDQQTQEKQAADQAAKAATDARTCPNCGHENADGVKFCQDCGAKLGAPEAAVCPNCGQTNPPGTRFCGGCGQRVGE